MPELPEVETVRAGLEPHMEGRRFARVDQRRPDLRFPFPEKFAQRLEGATIDAVGRRAKYLVLDLSTGECLIMHLGMSGSFRIEAAENENTPGNFHHERSKAAAHDHIIFELNDGGRVIYNDPRRFGFMDLVPRAELENCKHFAKMGIEPLGNELSGNYIAKRFEKRKTPLKAALLDQRHVAGLGNIYVCEALWRSGLSPTKAACTLVNKSGKPSKKATELAGHIRDVLSDAIAAGGSSLRDYSHTDGSLGYFQHSFAVYDRENEPCAKQSCNGIVERIVQSGRSTFYCPKCQK